MSTSGARRGVVLACAAAVLGALLCGSMILASSDVAGPVALVAGASLVAATWSMGRPARPRERVLVSVADRIYDGAILAPVIWVALADRPALAAAAMFAFGSGTLSAYARARACGLGYDLSFMSPASTTRVALLGLALTFGWGTSAYVVLAVWYLLSAAVRLSQVRKEELA